MELQVNFEVFFFQTDLAWTPEFHSVFAWLDRRGYGDLQQESKSQSFQSLEV